MSNLEILIKSEVSIQKTIQGITVKDFFKYSGKLKSKIKIFFSFSPF